MIQLTKTYGKAIAAFVKRNVAKLLAPYLVAAVAFLAQRFGLELPAEFAGILSDVASTFAAASAVALIGLAERAVALRTNPDNTAK